MSATEIEQLQEILGPNDNFADFTRIGDSLGGFDTVDVQYGENRRWLRRVTVITQSPTGRLYRWTCQQPLTEMGEWDRYDERIVEVYAQTKLVPTIEYVEIKEN